MSEASIFAEVQQAPPIEVFLLNEMCKNDPSDKRVNLTIGAYQDERGQPWVLPVVRMVETKIVEDPTLNHEYLPICGTPEYCNSALELVLGESSTARLNNLAFTVQALGGTGAVRLGAEFLKKVCQRNTVYISSPTWPNHNMIFQLAGFTSIREYRYWDSEKNVLDLEGMIADLKAAPEDSVVVIHGCAHNPTGTDPTEQQWAAIFEVVKERKLFPFFDLAYQGFASGNPDKDASSVRNFVEQGVELFIAQSFSKNFGLYGERTGALTVVLNNPDACIRVKSQLTKIIRTLWSNPPTYGARIVSTILRNAQYKREWLSNLTTMSQRIMTMRHELYRRLRELGTPGSWKHLVEQIGLFSYTGLSRKQVEQLRSYHIYLLTDGRANMCGLTPSNVQHVAESIHAVVTATN